MKTWYELQWRKTITHKWRRRDTSSLDMLEDRMENIMDQGFSEEQFRIVKLTEEVV